MYVMQDYHEEDEHAEILTQDVIYDNRVNILHYQSVALLHFASIRNTVTSHKKNRIKGHPRSCALIGSFGNYRLCSMLSLPYFVLCFEKGL